MVSTGGGVGGGLSFGVNGARERSANFTADFRDWRAKPRQSVPETFGSRSSTTCRGRSASRMRVAGVNFSGNAQSGYSSAVEIAYRFKRTVRGAWCGHTGKPLHDHQRLHGYVK